MVLLYKRSTLQADVDARMSDPSNGVPLKELTKAVVARDVRIATTVKG